MVCRPRDPFAKPEETLETMRRVRHGNSDKIFCLSTIGLNLEPYIDEIAGFKCIARYTHD